MVRGLRRRASSSGGNPHSLYRTSRSTTVTSPNWPTESSSGSGSKSRSVTVHRHGMLDKLDGDGAVDNSLAKLRKECPIPGGCTRLQRRHTIRQPQRCDRISCPERIPTPIGHLFPTASGLVWTGGVCVVGVRENPKSVCTQMGSSIQAWNGVCEAPQGYSRATGRRPLPAP